MGSTTALFTHKESHSANQHHKSVVAWSTELENELDDFALTYKAHPLGVKPSGNSLTANDSSAFTMGNFGRLPDETILVLFEWLDSNSLLNLGASCRGLFAYATTDQLWKDLFILYVNISHLLATFCNIRLVQIQCLS